MYIRFFLILLSVYIIKPYFISLWQHSQARKIPQLKPLLKPQLALFKAGETLKRQETESQRLASILEVFKTSGAER